MVFTSDITVNNLTYKLDTIGNIAVKVDNKTANAYNADVSITGNDNDVRLSGLYYTGEGRMDLKLALNQLNLAIVKAFSAGQLERISGYLKGNLNIQGTTTDPDIDGSLAFDNAFMVPTISGERIRIPDDAITIDGTGIHLSQFDLIDSAGRKATIAGDILTTDFKKYAFDLTLQADDFTLVNAPQSKVIMGLSNSPVMCSSTLNGSFSLYRVVSSGERPASEDCIRSIEAVLAM